MAQFKIGNRYSGSIEEITSFEPLDIEDIVIHTQFGLAEIKNDYLRIKSTYKPLHRLLYEHYHGIELDSKTHIHHSDGNKLNNHISNLMAVTPKEHRNLHKQLNKQPPMKYYQHIDKYFPRIVLDWNGNYVYLFKYSSITRRSPRIATIKHINLQSLKDIVYSKGLFWRTSANKLEYDNLFYHEKDVMRNHINSRENYQREKLNHDLYLCLDL